MHLLYHFSYADEPRPLLAPPAPVAFEDQPLIKLVHVQPCGYAAHIPPATAPCVPPRPEAVEHELPVPLPPALQDPLELPPNKMVRASIYTSSLVIITVLALIM